METLAKWIKKKLNEAFTPYLISNVNIQIVLVVIIVIEFIILLIHNIRIN